MKIVDNIHYTFLTSITLNTNFFKHTAAALILSNREENTEHCLSSISWSVSSIHYTMKCVCTMPWGVFNMYCAIEGVQYACIIT